MASADSFVFDVDSTVATNMTVTLSGIRDEGFEDIVEGTLLGLTVHRKHVTSEVILSFSGEKNLTVYTDVLRAINYSNTFREVTPGLRNVTVQVHTLSEQGALVPSLSSVAFLSVVAVNNHAPNFTEALYTFELLESSLAPSAEIGLQVSAFDEDLHGLTNITYAIYGLVDLFDVDHITGDVILIGNLDYELTPSIQFTVVASDNDGPIGLQGFAEVLISVIDANDNAPLFSLSSILIRVYENAAMGTHVYSAVAVDRDSSKNAQVSYSFQASSGNDTADVPFQIDAGSGNITVSGSIDRETTSEYELVVIATDSGIPSLSGNLTVKIEVLDLNDNPPVFEQDFYNVTLPESSPVDGSILVVMATDADLDGEIEYRLDLPAEVMGVFKLDPTSPGVILLASPLDFNFLFSEAIFNVVAMDTGGLFSAAKVCLTVLNENVNPPVFNTTELVVHLSEALPVGTTVASLTATDRDGDNITYLVEAINFYFVEEQISQPILSSQPFIITSGGFILTNESLDRETVSSYNIIVTADDSVHFATATVMVIVDDINDNDPILGTLEVNVTENAPTGTLLATLVAVDPDFGPNGAVCCYSIVSGNDDGSFSLVQANRTAELRTARLLDSESQEIFQLTIEVSDSGDLPRSTVGRVTIIVCDVNEPVVITLATNQINYTENSPQVAIFDGIAITDMDVQAGIRSGAVTLVTRCKVSQEILVVECSQVASCIQFCGEVLYADARIAMDFGLTVERTRGLTDNDTVEQVSAMLTRCSQ